MGVVDLNFRPVRNVVLFGAGASHGTEHVVPHPPPLGGELFHALETFDPQTWGSVPAEMAVAFGRDFERGMEQLMSGELEWFASLMQSMTRYFTQFRTDGTARNLYSQFFHRLMGSSAFYQTIFSTLNYECLLELALNEAGLSIAYYREMPVSDNARIWKLHGSCNFIPSRLALNIGRGARFDSSCQFDVPIEIVSPAEARAWVDGDTALYAAMSMYALDKPSQIAAAEFHEMRAIWARMVQRAERILVIGAKPNEQDAHIWFPLSRCSYLYYVGGREGFELWQEGHRRGLTLWLGETFETSLDLAVKVLTASEPLIQIP